MYSVYLLDDERWLLNSLYQSISWNDFNISIIGKSTSSIKAFEEIQTLKPDILITDIRMPDLNGLELIEKLIEHGIKCEYILLTGHAEFEYAKKAMEFNISNYCLKPFNKKEIITALEKAKRSVDQALILNSMNSLKMQSTSNNQTFNTIRNYILEHFKEDIQLNHIASVFFVNPSYLSSLFKKESGKTFSHYLLDLRLNYSCKLLKETNISITDISELCGFNNYAYFSRAFKNHLGTTPTKYRSQK